MEPTNADFELVQAEWDAEKEASDAAFQVEWKQLREAKKIGPRHPEYKELFWRERAAQDLIFNKYAARMNALYERAGMPQLELRNGR